MPSKENLNAEQEKQGSTNAEASKEPLASNPVAVKKYLDSDNADALERKLLSTLNTYPQQDDKLIDRLSAAGKTILFDGCMPEIDEENNTRQRKAFIAHVISVLRDENAYSSNPRNYKPRSFEEILGEKGVILYQKALHEEMTDKKYRVAAINNALTLLPGATWEKPAAHIIAAPSASGKTSATRRVLKLTKDLPEKTSADEQVVEEGNLVVSLDGGEYRKVSQMNKLAIRVANELGYSGIKDLHDLSKSLEHMKKVVRDIIEIEPNLGVIYPETYSGWINPFSGHKEFMNTLAKDRTLIFTLIEGVNEDFKEVVKFMGTHRAWKTDDAPVTVDLNNTSNLKESKAYAETGFYFGKMGSDAAFAYYVKQFGKQALTIKIPNDLILLRQNETTGDWVKAKAEDKDVFVVSQLVFDAWKQIKEPIDLKVFAEKSDLQLPLEISEALKSLLTSESTVNLGLTQDSTSAFKAELVTIKGEVNSDEKDKENVLMMTTKL